MEPGEIEFVGLDAPPAPLPWGPPRRALRLRLRLGLAVLVAAGLVAWVVTRSNGGGQDPVAAPTQPLTVTPDVHPERPLAGVALVVTCDVAADCSLATTASDATVAQVVAQYLPQAELTSISTTVGREHGADPVLAERLIQGHVQSAQLLVQIKPYLRPDPDPAVGISPPPPDVGSVVFSIETASFVVDVQWNGADPTTTQYDALQTMANDPRLESLG